MKGELTKTLKESVTTYLNMLIMRTDLEKLWKTSIMTVCNQLRFKPGIPWTEVNAVLPDSWPERFTQDLEDLRENATWYIKTF